MKLLTLKINKSFECILNLDKVGRVQSYLIQNAGGNLWLFSLPSYEPAKKRNQLPSVMIQMDYGPEYAYLYKYEETKQSPGVGLDASTKIDFYLYWIDSSLNNLSRSQIDALRDLENDYWDHRSLDSFQVDGENCISRQLKEESAQEFDVTFHLSVVSFNGKVTESDRSFRLFVAPEDRIENVSLDFGSEASQLLVYNQKDGIVAPDTSILDLFPYFKDKFDPASTAPDDEYVQYDPNPCLFRSHFMVPKRMTSPSYDAADTPVTNTEMKILMKYTDACLTGSDYMSLPNVKFVEAGSVSRSVIDSFGDRVPVQRFENRYFYRRAINSFLFRAMDAVASHSRQRDKVLFIRLYVLMPNVYVQSDVSEILGFIESDLEAIRTACYSESIAGIEVNSVSESDASFLGRHFSQPTMQWHSGRYLVMDAGKGTLDFSVIDYDKNASEGVTPFTCIYRSGIIGAGNALSFALFLDVLNAAIAPYLGGTDAEVAMQEIIKDVIENGDEAYLADLMSLVDKYKIVISHNAFLGSKTFSARPGVKLSDFDLPTIVEQVESLLDSTSARGYKLEETPYLDAMVRILVRDSLQELGYNGPLDYVILAGRGFLFTPFKDAMLEALKDKPQWASLQELPMDDDDNYTMKNVCLFATDDISLRKYDGRRVGVPLMVYDSGADYDEDSGDHANLRRVPLLKKVMEWILMKVRYRFSGKDSLDYMKQMELTDYLYGKEVVVKSAGDRVCISGSYYSFGNNVRGKVTLFFDGEDFTVRHSDQMFNFGPARARTARHYYESTFPYDSLPGRDIPFPHV